MTLETAIRELIANADGSVTDGELLDMIMEELDKMHDGQEALKPMQVAGGNVLQKNYERIDAQLGIRNNNVGGML